MDIRQAQSPCFKELLQGLSPFRQKIQSLRSFTSPSLSAHSRASVLSTPAGYTDSSFLSVIDEVKQLSQSLIEKVSANRVSSERIGAITHKISRISLREKEVDSKSFDRSVYLEAISKLEAELESTKEAAIIQEMEMLTLRTRVENGWDEIREAVVNYMQELVIKEEDIRNLQQSRDSLELLVASLQERLPHLVEESESVLDEAAMLKEAARTISTVDTERNSLQGTVAELAEKLLNTEEELANKSRILEELERKVKIQDHEVSDPRSKSIEIEKLILRLSEIENLFNAGKKEFVEKFGLWGPSSDLEGDKLPSDAITSVKKLEEQADNLKRLQSQLERKEEARLALKESLLKTEEALKIAEDDNKILKVKLSSVKLQLATDDFSRTPERERKISLKSDSSPTPNRNPEHARFLKELIDTR